MKYADKMASDDMIDIQSSMTIYPSVQVILMVLLQQFGKSVKLILLMRRIYDVQTTLGPI
jgi:hypothetical protein